MSDVVHLLVAPEADRAVGVYRLFIRSVGFWTRGRATRRKGKNRMPIPMPMNASWRIAALDPAAAPPDEAQITPRPGAAGLGAPALSVAVAAIVAVAAERARASGTLDLLRAAVAAALEPPGPPPAAPDPGDLEARLRSLFGGTPPV